MKNKKAIILLTITLASLQSYSQAKFAINGGVNLNNVAWDISDGEEPETKSRVGFHVGILMDLTINDELSFRPGLNYISKGASSDEDIEGDDYDRLALNYLEIPLIFNYSLNDEFFGFAGPYVAFGLGGKNNYRYDGEKGEINYKTVSGEINASEFSSVEDGFYESLDFGLNFGLGYNLNEASSISLGYSLGFNNIFVDIIDDIDDGFDESFNSDDSKAFNRVLSLTFTYLLN